MGASRRHVGQSRQALLSKHAVLLIDLNAETPSTASTRPLELSNPGSSPGHECIMTIASSAHVVRATVRWPLGASHRLGRYSS